MLGGIAGRNSVAGVNVVRGNRFFFVCHAESLTSIAAILLVRFAGPLAFFSLGSNGHTDEAALLSDGAPPIVSVVMDSSSES